MNRETFEQKVFQRVMEKLEGRGMFHVLKSPPGQNSVQGLSSYLNLNADDLAYVNDRGQLVLESVGDDATEASRRLSMLIGQVKRGSEKLGLDLKPDLRPATVRVPEVDGFVAFATFDTGATRAREAAVKVGGEGDPTQIGQALKAMGWGNLYVGNTYVAGGSGGVEIFVRVENGKVDKIGIGRKVGQGGQKKDFPKKIQTAVTPAQAKGMTESVREAQGGILSDIEQARQAAEQEDWDAAYRWVTNIRARMQQTGVSTASPLGVSIADAMGFAAGHKKDRLLGALKRAEVRAKLQGQEAQVSGRPFQHSEGRGVEQRLPTANQIGASPVRQAIQEAVRESLGKGQPATPEQVKAVLDGGGYSKVVTRKGKDWVGVYATGNRTGSFRGGEGWDQPVGIRVFIEDGKIESIFGGTGVATSKSNYRTRLNSVVTLSELIQQL